MLVRGDSHRFAAIAWAVIVIARSMDHRSANTAVQAMLEARGTANVCDEYALEMHPSDSHSDSFSDVPGCHNRSVPLMHFYPQGRAQPNVTGRALSELLPNARAGNPTTKSRRRQPGRAYCVGRAKTPAQKKTCWADPTTVAAVATNFSRWG